MASRHSPNHCCRAEKKDQKLGCRRKAKRCAVAPRLSQSFSVLPQQACHSYKEGEINKIIADRPIVKGKKKAKRKLIKLPDAPNVSSIKIPLKKEIIVEEIVEEKVEEKIEEKNEDEENNTIEKSGKLEDLLDNSN